MQYLLEVRWDDPVADAVARVLSSLPEGVEQMTGQFPEGKGHAFVVYRADSLELIERVAFSVSHLGARVRVTSITETA